MMEALMTPQDARALQRLLTWATAKFENNAEFEAALAFADAKVVGLKGEAHQRQHALAYQFAREHLARLRDA
jgi:hypothetical protein